jgi:hypothetical protein
MTIRHFPPNAIEKPLRDHASLRPPIPRAPSSGCRADFCVVQLAAACMFLIRKKAIR